MEVGEEVVSPYLPQLSTHSHVTLTERSQEERKEWSGERTPSPSIHTAFAPQIAGDRQTQDTADMTLDQTVSLLSGM